MILQGLVSHEQKLLKDYICFCIILHVSHLHSFEKFKFSWVVKNDCQAIVPSDMTHVGTTVEKSIFYHEADTTIWSQPPHSFIHY